MANYHKIDIQPIAIRMVNGDINAKNEIINYYTSRIIEIVESKSKDFDCDKDTLIKVGKTGLLRAIETYNLEKEIYFSGHIAPYIYGYIKRRIKKEKNKQEYKNREIQILANRMINGDSEAENKIIEFYSYHIRRIIKNKCVNNNCDKDDLIQAGLVGLANAMRVYILNPNNPFCVYANTLINKQIDNELKIANQTSNIEYIGLDNDYDENLFVDFTNDIENKEDLKLAFQKLAKIKKEILYLYLWKNYSFEAIGQIYGFSYENARLHYKSAIKILQKEILNKTNHTR